MKILLLSLLVIAAPYCFSQKTGNDLLKQCSHAIAAMDDEQQLQGTQNLDVAFCFGYISGVRDGAMSYQVFDRSKRQDTFERFCLPKEGIENGQMVRIVVKYLKDNPAKLHERAEWLILDALSNAFPCKAT